MGIALFHHLCQFFPNKQNQLNNLCFVFLEIASAKLSEQVFFDIELTSMGSWWVFWEDFVGSSIKL